MIYVIFSHRPWEQSPYLPLLKLLPDREQTYWIGPEASSGADGPSSPNSDGIIPIPFGQLRTLPPERCTALVAMPYLLPVVNSFAPRCMIAILERCPEGEDHALWSKYSGFLASCSDIVVSLSERIYLEQCLRRDGVFHLPSPVHGSMADSIPEEKTCAAAQEEVLRNAASAMVLGAPVLPLATKMWQLKAAYYEALHERFGDHETICYMLANYHYLMGMETAADYLAISFEQMLMKDHIHCLQSHYRFFSGIYAKAGDLEQAIRVYEISALKPEEKQLANQLKMWWDTDRHTLALAEIFKANEDFRFALQVLDGEQTPEATSLRIQNLLAAYRWKEALLILEQSALSEADQLTAVLVAATVDFIHGRPHPASRKLLRASVKDWNVFSIFADMWHVEQAASAVLGGSGGHA